MREQVYSTGNRPLEVNPIDSKAMLRRSDSFALDYFQFIIHCLKTNKFQVDPRTRVNMMPEPYRVDYDKVSEGIPLIQFASDLVKERIDDWEWLYKSLADDLSKDMLLALLAYRALGYRYVKLPLDCDNFWSRLSDIGKQFLEIPPTVVTDAKIGLKEYSFTLKDDNLKLLTDPFGVINEFYYSQYVYRGAKIYGPRPGDTIIDCGACFGGTSLFFATVAGAKGKVYSFEFIRDNLDVFLQNLERNPTLKSRIAIVERPVWNSTGVKMYMQGSGPGASFSSDPQSGGEEILTYTIDDLVEDQKLKSVDFVKMDVEGAEIAALAGASKSIQKFKPRLAISVYHRLNDFHEVPRFISNLRDDYKFYLQHSTVHGDETVVFAI